MPIRFTSHQEDDVEVVAAETADERPDVPRYEEARFSVNRQREPHETPLAEMMRHVVRIVSVEGPVHESEIVLRIRSLWGLARAGNRIRDAVLAALRSAKRKGDLVGGPFYSIPGQEVLVRDRSAIDSNTLRKPEYLPPEEIKVAIDRLVVENFGAEQDQLVLAVARMFGFGATSGQLREVVEGALNELLEAGKLRLDGRLVTQVQAESAPA